MIPKNITRDHVLEVIQQIDSGALKIPPEREVTKYCLIHNKGTYPPKYLISSANKLANGTELDPATFNGGSETNRVLQRLGFEVRKVLQNREGHPNLRPAPINIEQSPRSDADLVIALSKSMEAILEQIEPRGSNRDVAGWINGLERNNRIPKPVAFRMHGIRITRNKVIHEGYILSSAERRALEADWAAIDEWWKSTKRG